MTKTTLLAATALGAMALAGAASAQVITTSTISTQVRPQAGALTARVAPVAPATDTWAGGTVAALGTTAADVANSQYFLARESFVSAQNLATSGTTTTTALYLASGTAPNSFLGPIGTGGGTYQVTLTLTGGRFSLPVTPANFAFLRGDGAAAGALVPAGTIVAGGAVNDTFVTLQFAPTAGVDGQTLASSIGGVTIEHPFKVDAFNTNVGISVNTVIVTAGTNQPSLAGVVGTTAQRNRASVVSLTDGYAFVAGGVLDAATGASAFVAPGGVVGGADRIELPAYLTVAGDGIGQVQFGTRTQTGANATALRGLTGQAIPALGYAVRVNALNGAFGTTVNSLRPGVASGAANTAGTYAVGAGNAFATSPADVANNTATTVFINRGSIASAATTALATVDQRYSIVVTPTVPADNFIEPTALPARTYAAQTVQLAGASFIAPWVQSTNANYNTVIRVSNNGSVASGTVQVSLASPLNTPTATTCSLPAIAAGGELAINSANLTTCFGAFGRGDVTVRVLSEATDLTAKLRIVSPGGIVAEQSLGRTIN